MMTYENTETQRNRPGSITRFVGLYLATVLSLGACAVPETSAAGAPVSGGATTAPPTTLTTDQQNLLDQLETHELNSAYIGMANRAAARECMIDRGFTVLPSTVMPRELEDLAVSTKDPAAAALAYAHGRVPNSYSLAPETSLSQYGYQSLRLLIANDYDAAFAKLGATGQAAVDLALDGRDGNGDQVVPYSETCRGQADEQITGGPPLAQFGADLAEIVLPITDSLYQPGGLHVLGSPDSALVDAQKVWEECVAYRGNAPAWPPGAFVKDAQLPADKDALLVAADAEAAEAEVDATCAAEAGLNVAYRDAVREWRIAQIEAHGGALAKFFSIREQHVAAAKSYLGVD